MISLLVLDIIARRNRYGTVRYWRNKGRYVTIHRPTVKWRHISVVAVRSPFCGASWGNKIVLYVVKWWRFVALFE